MRRTRPLGLVVRRTHQVEQLFRPMKCLLMTVGDTPDDTVPRFGRVLRRCDPNDERLHGTSFARTLWVIFG